MEKLSRVHLDAPRHGRHRAGRRWPLVVVAALVAIVGTVQPALAEDSQESNRAFDAPAGPTYVPVGDIQTAAIDNKGSVRNGPTKPVAIELPAPIIVQSIQTYHWNNGRGQRPGTIAIRSAAGATYGPWRAIGKPGQGGVRNAYWFVDPGVVLPAGSYVLVDSSPKTWATNEAAGNRGFVVMRYQQLAAVPSASAAPASPDDGPGAETMAERSAPQEPPAADAWRSPERQTLFDGADSALFVHHSAAGGEFDRDARVGDGALVVDVAEGSGWGKVGIQSPEPLVWLDDFIRDAEVTVTYSIDAGRSTGFVAALAQPGWGGVGGNDPGNPNIAFAWFQTPDGASRAELHVNPHSQDDFWSTTGMQTAPATVSFTLRPGEVTVTAEGYDPITKPWDVAADGVGLRVWAYAQAEHANAPVKLVLTRITVDRRYPTAMRGPASVAPLPLTTVFDGAMNATWEPTEVAGGSFARFARLEDGALKVDAPEGNSWAKTGLLSAKPLITLDHRVIMAPARLAITLDPTKPENLVVGLSTKKLADMWPDHVVWFNCTYLPDRDRWALGVQHSGYWDWSRLVDPAWMRAHWSGEVWFDVGDGWAAVRIPDGPTVRGTVPTNENGEYYATVFAHAPAENAAVSLTLKRIERGIAVPPDMTAVQRWNLVEDSDFDPDGFLNDLAQEIEGLPQ